MGLQIETLTVGALQVNCYLVSDAVTARGVLVDPGDEADRITAAVSRAGVSPVAVLLTHAHVDHIGAVGAVCRRFDIPVYLHPADAALYLSPDNAIPPWIQAARDVPPALHRLPDLGGLDLRLLATPGHTPGGVCFYAPAAGMLLTGDTLFCGGVGRTDLPGGCLADLEHSVRTVLYALPEETRVFPGHGEPTRIGAEKSGNPFIRA